MKKDGGKKFLPVYTACGNYNETNNDNIKFCCFSIQWLVYGYVTGQNNIPELILIFVCLLALIL